MGCVSSSLLNHDEEFSQIGSNALGHHIVSLTSTTYGLLSLDPPTKPTCQSQSQSSCSSPGSRLTLGSLFPSTKSNPSSPNPLSLSECLAIRSEPEVINSWELMAGLDSKDDSFRFSPIPLSASSRPSTPKFFKPKVHSVSDKENSNPNWRFPSPGLTERCSVLKPQRRVHEQKQQELSEQDKAIKYNNTATNNKKYCLEEFSKVCPQNEDKDRVVLYTTTLRGVRSTFDSCNAVRSALHSLGYSFSERDISMDRGFRDELTHLLKQVPGEEHTSNKLAPPQLFVKGRYVGGAQEVLRIHEEGGLADLLKDQGLPTIKPGCGPLCDGCGGFSFLPCFRCHGSCKLITATVVMRCPDCNENGLVLCPICT